MSGCIVVGAGGINANCAKVVGAMKVPMITLPEASWTNRADFQNTETMRVKIQEALSVFIVREINGADVTQPELVNETTGFGKQVATRVTPGSVMAYIESNSCDFNEMMAAYSGGIYKIVSFTEDNKMQAHIKRNGVIEGFEAQVYAVPFGVGGVDNQTQQWRLQINWTNVDQFKSVVTVNSVKSARGLLELVPAGISAEVKTDYVVGTGIQVVNVFDRCDPTTIETDVLTAEIVDPGTEIGATSSPSSNSDGTYDVTIQDGEAIPGNLELGDYVKYRLVKKTGDIYEKISNAIIVNPNA